MRVLVTYGSKRGGTEGIAEMLAADLRVEGLEVELSPPNGVRNIDRFDAVLVGGALYANRWHRDASRFVRRHQDDLRAVPVWFFSSGPLDDSADHKPIPPTKQVQALMDRVDARGHATFGGRLTADAQGFPASAMARKRPGDWRSPEHVATWAHGVAESIRVSPKRASSPVAPEACAAHSTVQVALLICGILSSLVYVAANVAGAMRWQGYSSVTQTVSELFAIDAPSRPVVVPLLLAYDVLLIAFGCGVWAAPSRRRGLRVTGALLGGIGLLGLAGPTLASMHLRGSQPTLSDTMHIVLTVVISLSTLLALGFAATALGRQFRLYSITTMAIIVAFGALAGLDGPRLAANLPTPWVGVTERIDLGAYLLWVAVLAVVLLRAPTREGLPARSDLSGVDAFARRGARSA
jgi:menaquinone-dependent protoporphyrinogen IX oxidase